MKLDSDLGYDIGIEKGLVLEKGLPKGFVITDRNVYWKYKELINDNCFVVDPGEKSKSLEDCGRISVRLKDAERVVAFGGGVIGDLAGFVASVYKRGIPIIHVPTSLLAMVDSSIGGKTGVNLGELKNYIGTFYQPEAVLIDPLFLKTLPEKEFRNGLAEIIKYGIVFDRPDLQRLKKGIKISDDDLENIINECCRVKCEVVCKDVNDKGYRHILNIGHTIGHGIELLSGLSHGEAISVGMVKELELGRELGYVDKEKVEEARELLEINNLPTEFPVGIDLNKVIDNMKADKKGSLVFAFNKENCAVKVEEGIIRELFEVE